jgi:murein L,D-transpeptidase YafK
MEVSMARNAVILIIYLAIFVPTPVVGDAGINVVQSDADAKRDAWETDSLNEIQAVRGIIYDWIEAWQQKDIKAYMSYYSQEFRSGKLDYNGWQVKKARLFKRPGAISIQVSKLLILIEGNKARASFLQEYADAYISDVGEKNIKLIKLTDTWKIVTEEWKAADNKL